jgi:hypothetical protein
VNGWENVLRGPRWKIVKKPLWAGYSKPWQVVPPEGLPMSLVNMTFKTGTDAICAFRALTFNGGLL